MSPNRSQSPPKLPLVLLGLMTVATFGGPFVLALVISGGRRSSWPPDRPVEWCAFVLICGGVVVLMTACVAFALRAAGMRTGSGASSPLSPPFVTGGVTIDPSTVAGRPNPSSPPYEGGAGGGASGRDEPAMEDADAVNRPPSSARTELTP